MNCAGKKTPGGAGTHTGHTGAHRHADHTDASRPSKPTHTPARDFATTERTESAAGSTAAAQEPNDPVPVE